MGVRIKLIMPGEEPAAGRAYLSGNKMLQRRSVLPALRKVKSVTTVPTFADRGLSFSQAVAGVEVAKRCQSKHDY